MGEREEREREREREGGERGEGEGRGGREREEAKRGTNVKYSGHETHKDTRVCISIHGLSIAEGLFFTCLNSWVIE